MTYLLAILFVLATVGWADSYAEWRLRKMDRTLHTREIEAINKVGKWYQDRVAELEQENQVLASQIVALGTQPARVAMPVSPHDPGYEYSYDPTGLVREQLDPRDLPVA